MDQNSKKAFDQWLAENGLSVQQAISLAFVLQSNFSEMFKKKFIAAQYRMHLLTGLDEFKLTEEELERYQKLAKDGTNPYWDEKIATHFIQKWKKDGSLPDMRYCTWIPGKKNSKVRMRKYIRDEVFSDPSQLKPETDIEKDIPLNQEHEALITSIEQANGRLEGFIAHATPGDFQLIKKKAGKFMRKMNDNLNIMLDADPQNAAKLLAGYQKTFSHPKLVKK